jgi:hypothetical protein
MGHFHLLLINKLAYLAKLIGGVWIAWFYLGNQVNAQVLLTNDSKHIFIGQQVDFWKDTSSAKNLR